MRWLLIVLIGCGDHGGATTDGGRDTGGGGDTPLVDPLAGIGAVELAVAGYQFTEGPQWRDAPGVLVFSDIPANTIYSYTPGAAGGVAFRTPSGNSNGLATDGNGALIAAEHGTRSITRDGAMVVAMFEGKRLNSPNDVIVDGDGTIYFTDPPYGIMAAQRELDFMGVFRLAPNGQLTAERRGALTERPNGIGISPDGTVLYVDDTTDGKLWAYPIDGNGALGTRSELAMTAGNPDGLAIDTFGNIFVSTQAGVEVFAPTGTRWGAIQVPMQPANCAFGDPDHQTLYITARTALYRVHLANPGLPRR